MKTSFLHQNLWTFACAAGVFAPLVSIASTNIVTNGNFDGATTVDSATGDVLPTGWLLGPTYPVALSKVNVDTTVNAPTDLGPESGAQYLRFQSTANNGTWDCVYQDLNTVAGQQYTFSFWAAITSTSVGNTSGLHVIWDENQANDIDLGTDQSPANTGPVPYQMFSYTETASTNLTRIDFHGIDANGSVLVDNVSVSTVPEPASLALLSAGLGLAAMRHCRSRRIA